LYQLLELIADKYMKDHKKEVKSTKAAIADMRNKLSQGVDLSASTTKRGVVNKMTDTSQYGVNKESFGDNKGKDNNTNNIA
jgi:hypothetical protein